MPRKKLPVIDVNALIVQRTQEILSNVQDRLTNVRDNYTQNYQVLRALAEARLIKPEEVTVGHILYGGAYKFPQSKLPMIRAALGRIKEKTDGSDKDVRLEDGKKRLIKIGLRLEEFPRSDVWISYVRKYTKADEENFPCKIQEVEIPAQPAKPASKEYALVCPT